MTSYKVYNYNRAAEIAGRLAAADIEQFDDMEPRDIAKAIGSLADALAKEFNSYMEKNDLTDTGYSAPASDTPSPKRKRSGSSGRSSGRKSSAGRSSGGGGKGKPLSPKQRSFIQKMVRAIEDNGGEAPNDADSIEAIYSFEERNKLIQELRLLAYYDGDVDEWEAEADDEALLPDEYYE